MKLETKLKRLCFRTAKKLEKLNNLPEVDKLFMRAILLKEFYAKVCVMVVPQTVVPELTLEEQAKKLADERKPLGPPPPRKGGKSDVRT